ncbi:MAG: DUF4143 domain-containing protein, partial [Coriobacteriia bacterium]|nr:DUF4143 domain-containing protein [Coriobacteriia bacterium]
VLNTALMTALSRRTPEQALADTEWRGRLVESAVGAYLLSRSATEDFAVNYWREGGNEVDFVVEAHGGVFAIEVKSGLASRHHSGTAAFLRRYPSARPVLVGGDGIGIEDFLTGRGGL